jgi:hypothetical protein
VTRYVVVCYRLNQTEPATFTNLLLWSFFRDSYYFILFFLHTVNILRQKLYGQSLHKLHKISSATNNGLLGQWNGLKNGSYYSFPLGGGLLGERRPIFVQSISYTHGGILMKLHRNVHHYEKPCRSHEPGL